jgi:hypothetical protein
MAGERINQIWDQRTHDWLRRSGQRLSALLTVVAMAGDLKEWR